MRVRLITTALIALLWLLFTPAAHAQSPLQSAVKVWQARSDSVVILYDGENQFLDPTLKQVDERVVRERRGRETPERAASQLTWPGFTLRTNALYLLGLTPNLGVGWESENGFGVVLSGAWAGWQLDGGAKRYKLLLLNPEARYYFGNHRQYFGGVAGYWGQFNLKFDDTGRQGDAMGGGVVVGYRTSLGGRLGLEFSLAGGYARLQYDTYLTSDGADRLDQAGFKRNYFGPTGAGVSLIWTIP